MLPKKLQQKLNQRKENNAIRKLGITNDLVDFSSNDYLGFSKNKDIFNKAHSYLTENNLTQNGATGSRLLSGNYNLYKEVESLMCSFQNSESALVFNSGYDANIGFFSSVPQRGDIILYDELIHASIRDGITMSIAKAYKFKHNDLEDLKSKILRFAQNDNDIYVVTESVFSMDGDSPNLIKLVEICKKYKALLIIDEAHAIGVFGKNGRGLIQHLNLEDKIFARLVTFGKALGCHGAAILGSLELKQYLINFSRSFIYTTALPPHSLATIKYAYKQLVVSNTIEKTHQNIQHFKSEIERLQLKKQFIESQSTIHCYVISGNSNVKAIALQLQNNGFDVKPILSPTVPKGEERLRFCIHSYNSKQEITKVLELLATFVSK